MSNHILAKSNPKPEESLLNNGVVWEMERSTTRADVALEG